METYKDRHGRFISVGDVLVYNEGDGYGQSIEEVIEHDGELATLMRVGEPKWTLLENQEPMPMKYHKLYPSCSDNTAIYCSIADVPHDEAFTVDFAESQFGA
jgi:hypothetical protein